MSLQINAIRTCVFLCALVAGCGGGNAPSTPSDERKPQFLAAPIGGSDRLVLTGDRSDYKFTGTAASTYTITSTAGVTVGSAAAGLKRIQFADISWALDLDSAGRIYSLYRAAFNRSPDVQGLGYWLYQFDAGTTLEQIAAGFIASAEFTNLYGRAPTDAQFVTALYNNVLHRIPDAGGLAYWVGMLQRGSSRAATLIAFSDSAENQAQVAAEFVGGMAYVQPGIAYRPVARTGAIQTVTAGTVVTLNAADSTDANDDILQFDWSLSLPAGSRTTLISATSSRPVFLADIPGDYIATLRVSDGKLAGLPVTINTRVNAAAVSLPDTGIYKCTQISHESALALYSQGHTYLDRDRDGKPCEANDKQVEISVTPPVVTPPVVTPPVVTPPSTGPKTCWVNGYRRSNGTYVSGYWRRC